MTVFGTLVDPLTRPTEFFERRDPPLRSGLSVVVVAATLRAAVVLPIVYVFRFVFADGEILRILAVSVAFMYAYALVRWVVLGAVVYGVSRPLGGEGRFRDLLGYLGWSHLPNALVGLVVLATTTGTATATSARRSSRPRPTLAAANHMTAPQTSWPTPRTYWSCPSETPVRASTVP